MLVVKKSVSVSRRVIVRGRNGKNIEYPRTDAHHTQRTAPARDRAANAARRPARSRAGVRVHIDTRRAALTAPITAPTPPRQPAARRARCAHVAPHAGSARGCSASRCRLRRRAARACDAVADTRREAAVSALGGDRGGVSAAPAGRRVAGGAPAAGAVVVVALRDLWGRGGHANPPCGGRPGRPTAARGPRTGRRPTRR